MAPFTTKRYHSGTAVGGAGPWLGAILYRAGWLVSRRKASYGSARPLTVHRNADHWFDLGDKTALRLTELDVVLMRKDPPFDMEYIYATYLLERAEQEGTLVVNRCQSLRDCNEKLFATEFPSAAHRC
ncbi:MAG: hypothetical protein CM15mP25_2260 [Gammaproteobacteria bacterium]|nr:MAG: hypothetical protein CM15mP25_2260 [Gammaproteobacteria bacterium]